MRETIRSFWQICMESWISGEKMDREGKWGGVVLHISENVYLLMDWIWRYGKRWMTNSFLVWATQCMVVSFAETEEVQVFWRVGKWIKTILSWLTMLGLHVRFPSVGAWRAVGYSQWELRREIRAVHRKLWVYMVYRWYFQAIDGEFLESKGGQSIGVC